MDGYFFPFSSTKNHETNLNHYFPEHTVPLSSEQATPAFNVIQSLGIIYSSAIAYRYFLPSAVDLCHSKSKTLGSRLRAKNILITSYINNPSRSRSTPKPKGYIFWVNQSAPANKTIKLKASKSR